MEQIQQNILLMAQGLMQNMTKQKMELPQTGDKSKDFQKMLSEKKSGTDKPDKKDTKDQPEQKDTQSVEVDADAQVRAQAALSAMMVMVAPAEEVMQTSVEIVVEAAPVMLNTEDKSEQVPQELLQTVETSVEVLTPKEEAQVRTDSFAQTVEETTAVVDNSGVQEVKQEAATEEIRPQSEEKDSENAAQESGVTEQPVFEKVEAAPVKVSEVAQRPEVERGSSVESQLTDQIASAVSNGETRLEIALTPENLGTVKVQVVHSANGGLQIALLSESSQTRGMLEKGIAALQQMLSERMRQPVRVEVETPYQNWYDGRNGAEQENRQQQQRQDRQKKQEEHHEDFLQQLRLGLIPVE